MLEFEQLITYYEQGDPVLPIIVESIKSDSANLLKIKNFTSEEAIHLALMESLPTPPNSEYDYIIEALACKTATVYPALIAGTTRPIGECFLEVRQKLYHVVTFDTYPKEMFNQVELSKGLFVNGTMILQMEDNKIFLEYPSKISFEMAKEAFNFMPELEIKFLKETEQISILSYDINDRYDPRDTNYLNRFLIK